MVNISQADDISPQSPDKLKPSGEQLMKQGRKASERGHFIQAVRHWESASKRYLTQKQPQGRVRALYAWAKDLQNLGRYPLALKKLHTALNLTPDIASVDMHAKVLDSLGQVYMRIGDADTARQYLNAGLEIALSSSFDDIQAALLISLGNLAMWEKRADAGLEYYRQSAALAQRIKNSGLEARAQINMARVYYETGQYTQALVLLSQASEALRGQPDTHSKAYSLTAVGRLYSRIFAQKADILPENQTLQLAFETLRAASTISAALDDRRTSSYVLGYLGNLYESRQRFKEALQLTNQAITLLQNLYAPEMLYQWHWQAGRLLASSNELKKAISAYQRAANQLEQVRNDLLALCPTCARPSFRQRAEPVLLELANLLLRRSETLNDDQKVQNDLKTARDYMEQLKILELQDYYEDECITATAAKQTSLDQILRNTAVIYPIPFAQNMQLVVSFPQRMRRYRTQVNEDELRRVVNRFRSSLEQPRTRQHRYYGAKLYEWLIRPLQTDLDALAIHTLVFVPDGMLRTIPMAALFDSERQQFLIEQYALAVTPGLSLTAPRPMPRENVRILISALTRAVRGQPALKYVPREIQAIQNLYANTLLENEDFTFDNMAKEYSQHFYTMIHVASHGEFHGDPTRTYLTAFDGKITLNAFRNVIEPGLHREKAVELLCLSACQTAVGDERAALGLAGVGIQAGARSVLASLWFIDDESSAELVTAFYEQLQNRSLSRAQALQNAQLQLLQNRRFRHPVHWAAFMLIGNWL